MNRALAPYFGLKMFRVLTDPLIRQLPLALRVQLYHYRATRRWPNLTSPRTFSDAISAHKVYLANNLENGKLVEDVASKYFMRNYVNKCLGPGFLPKLYFKYDSVGDVRAAKFPDRCVIKPSNSSGRVVHWRRERDQVRVKEVLRELHRWSDDDRRFLSGEWWYSKRPMRILVEEDLSDENEQPPPDYKFFTFGGHTRLVEVDVDRRRGHKQSFYTPDWQRLDVVRARPSAGDLPRPAALEQMLRCAAVLGEPFPFLRVDFYVVGDRLLVGELTHAPAAGWLSFSDAALEADLAAAYTEARNRQRAGQVFAAQRTP